MNGVQYKDLRDLLEAQTEESQDFLTTQLKNSGVRQSCSFQRLDGMQQLSFPLIYGLRGGTHPSVKFFPNGWNGYKFWLAYTPYPNVARENPVVVTSQDGREWITPEGLINPLAEQPDTGYNSDTELVFTPAGKLRCYWRWYTQTSAPSILRYKESADGISWGEMVDCVLPEGVDPLSPCIYVDKSSAYTLWVGSGYGAKMRKLESVDGITWTGVTDCITTIDGYGYHWHPMVWKEMGSYCCLSNVVSNEPSYLSNPGDLYFGKSSDGINWEFDINPVFFRGQEGIKNYRVYRSCAVRVGDKHMLYISGYGAESEQVHVTEAVLNI